MDKINETKIKVRYAETDQMGVVHHSRYYPWFEVGRTELFAKGGKTYGDMDQFLIFLDFSIDNKKNIDYNV